MLPHAPTPRARLRQRPDAYDYVVNGSYVHVVNWSSDHNLTLLKEAGLGGVPCSHPKCCGSGGQWHTSFVRWTHTTRYTCRLAPTSHWPHPFS